MASFGRRLGSLIAFPLLDTATVAIAQLPCLLAQAHAPTAESYASWMFRSLGFFGFLSLLTGVAIFVGACLVVFVARRPAVIASYLVFLVLPLLLAAIGALKGNLASFVVLASADIEIKQSQIFAGLSETLLPLSCALTVTLPSFLVLAIGLFVRTLRANEAPTSHRHKTESEPANP